MIIKFDEVKVGERFKIADCEYTKMEEHTQNWNTGLGPVRLGTVNATHTSAVGKVVEDYFGPGNVVEVDRPEK